MSPTDSLAAAYAACARLARTHDENFPVASVLLPRRMRLHVAAVYAFARVADDFADEGEVTPDERLHRLDDWHQRLLACTAPRTLDPGPWTLDPGSRTPSFSQSSWGPTRLRSTGFGEARRSSDMVSRAEAAPPRAAPRVRPSTSSGRAEPFDSGHPELGREMTFAQDRPVEAGARQQPQALHPAPGLQSAIDDRQLTVPPLHDAVFLALGHTIRTRQLPLSLFEDLLSAFRQDVIKHRYATWDELLDYCRRSANPVGRLVLRIAGYADERLDRSSDCLCTALQLTNLWQDLDRDRRRGRFYLPADIRQRWGATAADLERGQLTPEWKQALADAVERTNGLFAHGKPVCDASGGRLRVELRLTWLGGTRILERLQQIDYDPLTVRPTLGRYDVWLLLWRLITWRRSRALKNAP